MSTAPVSSAVPTLDEDLEDAAASRTGPGEVPPGVRRARAWLSRVIEPGSVDFWRFVDDAGPVEAVRRLRARRAPERITVLVGSRVDDDRTVDDLQRATRAGARLVVPEDDEWPGYPLHSLTLATSEEPEDFRHQEDRTRSPVPPVGLWVRGNGRLDDVVDRSVAIVGSRASTAYGEHVAGEMAAGLGERGWTVLSGGAFGIDAAAHRGALAVGGTTVAVLACGVDRVYPAAHGALFSRIAESGLIVSELPPGCAPLRHRFLVRNRLIAGLTRGTVVVEAAARSGAQATAKRARRLGKQVMVVPGPVTSAMSVGCHELLRDTESGAQLVASAAHVIDAVGGLGVDLAGAAERPATPRDGLSDLALRVLDACPVRAGVPPERLASIAGCDVLEVLRVLPALEVAGLVQWTGTGWRVAPAPRKKATPSR
ncbi:MAG: protecting protein DprA [Frankiales bacterium]|nr:protecting protein DprA [Frankiales bacterium]